MREISVISISKVLALLLVLSGMSIGKNGAKASACDMAVKVSDVVHAEWASNNKGCALLSNQNKVKGVRVTIVPDVSKAYHWALQIKDVADDGGSITEGRPTCILLWSADGKFIGITYLNTSKSRLNFRLFTASTGKLIGSLGISTKDNAGAIKSNGVSPFVQGAWAPGGAKIALAYNSNDGHGALVNIIDLHRLKSIQKINGVMDFSWYQRDQFITLTANGRVSILSGQRKVELRYNSAKGRILDLAVSKDRIFTLQKAYASKEVLTVSAFTSTSKHSKLLWSQSSFTGRGKQYALDEIHPSPSGHWVAVSTPYGTDGSSNNRVWCISKGIVIPPTRLIPNNQGNYLVTDNAFLTWRGSSLLLSSTFSKRNVDDDKTVTKYSVFNPATTRSSVLKRVEGFDMDYWPSRDYSRRAVLVNNTKASYIVFQRFI